MTAIGNQEIFNAYLLWGEKHYQLDFFGQTHAGVVAGVARRDHLDGDGRRRDGVLDHLGAYRKEPDEIIKLAIGALIAAGAPLILALASANRSGRRA